MATYDQILAPYVRDFRKLSLLDDVQATIEKTVLVAPPVSENLTNDEIAQAQFKLEKAITAKAWDKLTQQQQVLQDLISKESTVSTSPFGLFVKEKATHATGPEIKHEQSVIKRK